MKDIHDRLHDVSAFLQRRVAAWVFNAVCFFKTHLGLTPSVSQKIPQEVTVRDATWGEMFRTLIPTLKFIVEQRQGRTFANNDCESSFIKHPDQSKVYMIYKVPHSGGLYGFSICNKNDLKDNIEKIIRKNAETVWKHSEYFQSITTDSADDAEFLLSERSRLEKITASFLKAGGAALKDVLADAFRAQKTIKDDNDQAWIDFLLETYKTANENVDRPVLGDEPAIMSADFKAVAKRGIHQAAITAKMNYKFLPALSN